MFEDNYFLRFLEEMVDMVCLSIDSMWKYSYEGSKYICILVKKVIIFMF